MQHLEAVLPALRAGAEGVLFLAGDSSLDNKHWLFGNDSKFRLNPSKAYCAPAVNGYEKARSG